LSISHPIIFGDREVVPITGFGMADKLRLVKLPNFSGCNDLKFSEWLTAFNGVSNILELNEQEKALACYGFLTDKALQVFIQAFAQKDAKLADALHQVECVFGQPPSSINTLQKLKNLKQQEDSISIYYQKFCSLLNDSGISRNSTEGINFFRFGLNSFLAKSCIGKTFDDLDSLYSFLFKYEQEAETLLNKEDSVSVSSNSKTWRRKKNHSEINSDDENFDQIKSHKFRYYNRFRSRSPSISSSRSYKSVSSVGSSHSDFYSKPQIKCFYCKKPGHFIRECRFRRNNDKNYQISNIRSKSSPLFLFMWIEGTWANVMIDTGASTSLVNHLLVKNKDIIPSVSRVMEQLDESKLA
jgi:hypothetical protein